jgi:hypothetical protein
MFSSNRQIKKVREMSKMFRAVQGRLNKIAARRQSDLELDKDGSSLLNACESKRNTEREFPHGRTGSRPKQEI